LSHSRAQTWASLRIAVRTEDGWRYEPNCVSLGPQQRAILGGLAREFDGRSIPRAAVTRIADSVGAARGTVWTQLIQLQRKFGASTLIELAFIARQITNIRGRGRSSTRASMFVAVQGKPVNAGAQYAGRRTEALHPGAAPLPRPLTFPNATGAKQ